MVKSLFKKRIAVMFLDNLAARGAYRSYGSQQKMPHWSTWIDTFKAPEYLSKDPKVNIKKVEITG